MKVFSINKKNEKFYIPNFKCKSSTDEVQKVKHKSETQTNEKVLMC